MTKSVLPYAGLGGERTSAGTDRVLAWVFGSAGIVMGAAATAVAVWVPYVDGQDGTGRGPEFKLLSLYWRPLACCPSCVGVLLSLLSIGPTRSRPVGWVSLALNVTAILLATFGR